MPKGVFLDPSLRFLISEFLCGEFVVGFWLFSVWIGENEIANAT